MLGIIGAMDEEVARLKEMISGLHIVQRAGMEFYKGQISEKDVVVVKCGVGKVNAAMCTQSCFPWMPSSILELPVRWTQI